MTLKYRLLLGTFLAALFLVLPFAISHAIEEDPGDPNPGIPVSCSPASQTVNTNQSATFEAFGGETYTWTATGGNPTSGVGDSFSTYYTGSGTKTVRVSKGTGPGSTATCSVTVTAALPPLSCSPSSQSVYTNHSANITASGGSGSYSWSAPDGTPSSGTQGSLAVSYATTGTKTITVSSGSATAQCSVSVSTEPPATCTTASIGLVSPITVNSSNHTATVTLRNNSTLPGCSIATKFSSFKVYYPQSDPRWNTTQTSFDNEDFALTTGQSRTYTIDVPSCSYQLDAYSFRTDGSIDFYDYDLDYSQPLCTGATPHTPTAAFTGSSACTVTGWADDVDTTAPRPFRLYDGGTLIPGASGNAGATSCVGSACTFSRNLTGLISAGVPHTITGKVQDDTGTWHDFTNSQTSLSVTCPLTPPPGVSCAVPSAGQTGVSYTFTGYGGSSYTWGISPTTGMSPAGSTGSTASFAKSFTTPGPRTATFTSGGQSGSCVINILSALPTLSYSIKANGSDGPITVAYGSLPTLSWTSSGADRVDNFGSVPVDEAWNGSQPTDLSGFVQISPLVRTVYSGRGVKNSPIGSLSDSVTVRVQPQCLPAGQTVEVGQAATLTAAGGNGTYAWTATGGSTASGTGSSLSTSYATEGTKTVSLVSDSLTTTCTVTVAPPASTGTVVVNSVNAQGEPFLSTWTLSGLNGSQTPGSPTASVTYTDQPAGLYTLTAASVEGYTSAIEPGAGQNLVAGDIITYTITYTDVPINEEAWVDLRANPTSVDSGQASTLSWTSYGIESRTCVATGDWAGSKDDEGSESTGALTEATSYTITCDVAQVGKGDPATVSDTVTVLIGAGDDDDGDPQCSNGIDDDGDELIDFGEEPIEQCEDAQDNLEAALPPPPGDDDDDVIIGACGDGFDNDGDGTIDEADSGCDSGDNTEQSEPDIREI